MGHLADARIVRASLAAISALLALLLAPGAQAANFGVHAGLADDLWADPYFRAGALLADVDHWLPPGEPQTDSVAFSLGMVQRAWPLSRHAWRFATGWYEHLDQDARYGQSYGRIVAAYPAYTDTDVRLAFDYWTLRKHPFPENFDWILNDGEVLQLIADGLTATDASGVRAAVDLLLHSTDFNEPGLALQLQAARAYGVVYPDRVANMQAEYDRFYRLVTAGYSEVLPRIDLRLRTMATIVARYAANPAAAMPILRAAMDLEAVRPTGWMPEMAASMVAFVSALPSAALPLGPRLNVAERAWAVADLLT